MCAKKIVNHLKGKKCTFVAHLLSRYCSFFNPLILYSISPHVLTAPHKLILQQFYDFFAFSAAASENGAAFLVPKNDKTMLVFASTLIGYICLASFTQNARS